jgi:hypothetical protein
MLLIPIISYPVEEGKKIQKHQVESEKESGKSLVLSQFKSDTFIDTINRRYINHILEAENKFSELLKGSFREYKVMPVDKMDENSKPERIPGFRKARKEIISTQLNARKIPYEEPDEIIIQPYLTDAKSPGVTNKVLLQFHRSSFYVDFDQQLSQLPETVKIDPDVLKSSYDYLRKTNFRIVMEQFAEICRQMNLNDWDYYCLINEFSTSINDDPNIQKVVAWFLLLESNYKVKIGYFNDSATVLFGSAQTMYDTPWFNINGERYYAINYEYDTIVTYNINYFKGYKYLNIFNEKPLLLNEFKKDKTINFTHEGKMYSIPLSFNQNYVDYYAKYPTIPVDFYFALPVSSTFKESVDANIAPYLYNKSTFESLHFLLSLVQYGFDYKTDKEQFNHEKYMVPEEMLFYSYSDCEDRSIMFSFLVSELLDKDIIELDFNGHICSAVEVSDSSEKGNLIYNNKEYIVCDPTYTGAPPGIILKPYKIKDAVVIDFNSNFNHFMLTKKTWNSLYNKGLLNADNTRNANISQDGTIFLTGMVINDSLLKNEIQNTYGRHENTFIARLDATKEIKWEKQFQGSDTNFGYCISEVNDQLLYVFGYFENTLSFDDYEITENNNGSFFIAKLDKSGDRIWLKPIVIPSDSLSQGITVVLDSNGNIEYYMLNNHFPYSNNYMMQVDGKGNCYINALIPSTASMTVLNRTFSIESGDKFDIVSYLINNNDNLIKQNYPRSVSLLYTLFQYLINNGSLIDGSSLQKTISTIYKDAISNITNGYSDAGKISEISNYNGITWIKTVNKQPVIINNWQAQHESRLKLSFTNGYAKIGVLNGIKNKGDQVWKDVNYILLDKVTGEIKLGYGNQYQKKMPVPSQLL